MVHVNSPAGVDLVLCQQGCSVTAPPPPARIEAASSGSAEAAPRAFLGWAHNLVRQASEIRPSALPAAVDMPVQVRHSTQWALCPGVLVMNNTWSSLNVYTLLSTLRTAYILSSPHSLHTHHEVCCRLLRVSTTLYTRLFVKPFTQRCYLACSMQSAYTNRIEPQVQHPYCK